MRQYILRRLFLMVPVILGVYTMVFLIIHFIPGDPIDLMLVIWQKDNENKSSKI